MPPLDWLAFTQLTGAATRNWELLCRELIRRSYGRYGTLRSVAQQPGVEFHLELAETCDLGEPPRWWGWQCRWYELPAGTQIGTARRQKIEKAIATTEKVLPQVTDWVLWTVRPLTPTDQEWFEGLPTRLTLHQWTAAEVEGLLTGDAAVLCETFFGALILNAARLERLHELSVAPLRQRWDPAIHVEVHVEAKLNRVLGDVEAWFDLPDAVDRLSQRSAELAEGLVAANPAIRPVADALIADLGDLHARAMAVASALAAGRLFEARGAADVDGTRRADPADIRRAARASRARSEPVAQTLIATLDEIDVGDRLLRRIGKYVGLSLVAVLGDAGRGKTYLAAQLTAPQSARPAGCVLRGRDLAAHGTLDDLARRLLGIQVDSFEALVAALDAAGARSGRRLPLVIDGLNEAENPRDWNDLLAPLPRLLEDYPHVLVVVTLRSSVADGALPADTPSITLRGFAGIERDAARRYLEYYKINAGEVRLPLGHFAHPLFLRLFCEATNPTRETWVGVEAIPSNLDAVFRAYRDAAVERVANDLRRNPADVAAALDSVAFELWRRNARTLPFDDVRELVGDTPGDWDATLARALEEEGVLLRDGGADDQRSEIAFDAFAGFMVGDALARHHQREVAAVLEAEETQQRLALGSDAAHPLVRDILAGLAGAMPFITGQQLWPRVDGAARVEALRVASDLPPSSLDHETLHELPSLVRDRGPATLPLFDRLRDVRSAAEHPLNALFLDRLLRSLSIADRDLAWTEWVRDRASLVVSDLDELESAWKDSDGESSDEDALNALWVSWLLTSTVRPLRDHATRTLFQFGRRDPAALFSLALNQIDVDDPYVSERLLAAAYGTVMSNQITDGSFEGHLRALLQGLVDRLSGEGAIPLQHWLPRQYVRGIFEAAAKLFGITEFGQPTFKDLERAEPIIAGRRSEHEVSGAFRMDFENYTIGGLVNGRGNYDFEHEQYKAVLASIRGRVWNSVGAKHRFRRSIVQSGDGPILRTSVVTRPSATARSTGGSLTSKRPSVSTQRADLTLAPARLFGSRRSISTRRSRCHPHPCR